MDHLVFTDGPGGRGVNHGDALLIEATVVRCYTTSAEVLCRVLIDPSLSSFDYGCLDPDSDSSFCVAHAYFVFVRLDRGKMPKAFPQTSFESQAFEMAGQRRLARLHSRQKAPPAAPAPVSEFDVSAAAIHVTVGTGAGAGTGAGTGAGAGVGSVPCDKSLLEFTHIVLPSHANHMGNLFGGEILQWAEEIAVLSATKHLKAAIAARHPLLFFTAAAAHQGEQPEVAVEAPPPPAPAPAPTGPTEAAGEQRRFSLSSVYISGMSFLQPSTVGDRVILRAQCCRTFGSVAEVEVVVTAEDVERTSVRHINTGYFLICCRDVEDKREILFPTVEPVTVEEQQRFEQALRRMVVASVRSATGVSLESPGELRRYAAQSSSVSLADMLALQETSIWNSSLPSSLALSPQFEADLAPEVALQDTAGLLCALSGDGGWQTMPAALACDFVSMQLQAGISSGVTRIKLEVLVSAPIPAVAALLLDLERRPNWDSILTGREVKKITESVSLVWMGSAGGGLDYALLRCHQQLEDGRVAIVSRSILHPDIHPPAGEEDMYTRGEVLPSGFLLSPAAASDADTEAGGEGSVQTKLQYLLQLDSLSREQFSAEIQGKQSQGLLQALIKLKRLVEEGAAAS
jgi:acyl-CoA hydrolase